MLDFLLNDFLTNASIVEFFINAVLLLYLAILAVAIYRIDNLFAATMLLGIYSLLCASIFVVMDAVDVAFTEAAIGAGLSTILILTALSLCGYREQDKPDIQKNSTQAFVSLIIVCVLGALLAFGFHDIPAFGQLNTPAYQGVAQHYIHQTSTEIDLPNLVTAVLASYRGYDTLGEVCVVFTAGITVLAILGYGSKTKKITAANHNSQSVELQQYIVLRVVSRMILPFIMIFALYVQFHGDFGPGGGFQAGVIFASAIILHILFYGHSQTEKVIAPETTCYLMAIGVLIFGGTGIVTMLLGGNFLDYNFLNVADPIQGQHWGILIIEFGVGVTVAAVMLSMFYSFSKSTKD